MTDTSLRLMPTTYRRKLWSFAWQATVVIFCIAEATFYALPASVWVTVDSLQVVDAKVGRPPSIVVAWTTHWAAKVTWTVHIQNATPKARDAAPVLNPDPGAPDDEHVSHCDDSQGEKYMRPDDAPLRHATLDWLTWPLHCRPPAGQYIAVVEWTVDALGTQRKHMRTFSNVFTISE